MDYNTEEIMREDFARVVELNKQIRDGAGPDIGHNVEYGREMAARERNGFVKAWSSGPHAEHWDTLRGAHKAFELVPDAMVGLYADIRSGRNAHGLDGVDQRSVFQVAEMRGRDNPNLRHALIEATRDRRRTPIERSR
ncbi:hypothetical protein [Nocardia sp. XZ_19_231]|uniref:hypothetical protein n=1 Tax=Nocardia sp. XZ_19_231 TaxID=2769252 RepID=UPI00188F9FF7|nr:hypothetical protein [Nocardia sp. XZ_19_231]